MGIQFPNQFKSLIVTFLFVMPHTHSLTHIAFKLLRIFGHNFFEIFFFPVHNNATNMFLMNDHGKKYVSRPKKIANSEIYPYSIQKGNLKQREKRK